MENKLSNEGLEYENFLPQFFDCLENISNEYLDIFNEHKAFVYFVGELFETIEEGKFVYTDGPNDGNIDFFVRNSPVYTIYQCKCPSYESLITKKISVYDANIVDELISAVNIILNKESDFKIKEEIRSFKTDFHMEKDKDIADDLKTPQLVGCLAIMGKLSDPAKKAFKAYQKQHAEENINLRLIEWKDIYDKINIREELPNFKVTLKIQNHDDILRKKDYCFLIGYAYDFYEAFRQHGWMLFDLNVRYQIPNSTINKKIVNTLIYSQGRRNFHHLNNGLLIICDRYSIKNSIKNDLTTITLTNPQIINGCQTVRSICEAYESLTPEKQREFREETRIQVKIIQKASKELIDELVITTNDQNPMNQRNLKSNAIEQRELQNKFNQMPQKWFYQRKDGEFKSLALYQGGKRGFKKSNYTISQKKYRIIDNQELAKYWYSFIGLSDKNIGGGIKYFEKEGIYDLIFKSCPNDSFWDNFHGDHFTFSQDYFDHITPGVYQYLLSFVIAKYIKSNEIKPIFNKREAIKRGIKNGILKGDLESGKVLSNEEEVSKFLLDDEDYFLNRFITNSFEVLIELYSFLLTRKYGKLDNLQCWSILTQSELENKYLKSGLLDKSPLDLQKDKSILASIYGFILYCFGQFYFTNKAEIRSAPRLKLYFSRRDKVNKLREFVIRKNSDIIRFDEDWKKRGKSLLESLPDL